MVTIKEAYDRYVSERHEVVRCFICESADIQPRQESSPDGLSIDKEDWFCNNCGDYTDTDVETFSEWAERVGLDFEEDE